MLVLLPLPLLLKWMQQLLLIQLVMSLMLLMLLPLPCQKLLPQLTVSRLLLLLLPALLLQLLLKDNIKVCGQLCVRMKEQQLQEQRAHQKSQQRLVRCWMPLETSARMPRS